MLFMAGGNNQIDEPHINDAAELLKEAAVKLRI